MVEKLPSSQIALNDRDFLDSVSDDILQMIKKTDALADNFADEVRESTVDWRDSFHSFRLKLNDWEQQIGEWNAKSAELEKELLTQEETLRVWTQAIASLSTTLNSQSLSTSKQK